MQTFKPVIAAFSAADARIAAGDYTPLDPAFDYGTRSWERSGGTNPRHITNCVAIIEALVRGLAIAATSDGVEWQATTDGGSPKIGYGRVLAVAMRPWGRDGKMEPHVLIEGWRWTTWEPWSMLARAYQVGSADDPAVQAKNARPMRYDFDD